MREGGDPDVRQCGWLQIVPVALQQMSKASDVARAGEMMNAMLKVKKLDVAALQKARGDG